MSVWLAAYRVAGSRPSDSHFVTVSAAAVHIFGNWSVSGFVNRPSTNPEVS